LRVLLCVVGWKQFCLLVLLLLSPPLSLAAAHHLHYHLALSCRCRFCTAVVLSKHWARAVQLSDTAQLFMADKDLQVACKQLHTGAQYAESTGDIATASEMYGLGELLLGVSVCMERVSVCMECVHGASAWVYASPQFGVTLCTRLLVCVFLSSSVLLDPFSSSLDVFLCSLAVHQQVFHCG